MRGERKIEGEDAREKEEGRKYLKAPGYGGEREVII